MTATQLNLLDLLAEETKPELVTVDWMSPAGEIHKVTTTPMRAQAMVAAQWRYSDGPRPLWTPAQIVLHAQDPGDLIRVRGAHAVETYCPGTHNAGWTRHGIVAGRWLCDRCGRPERDAEQRRIERERREAAERHTAGQATT